MTSSDALRRGHVQPHGQENKKNKTKKRLGNWTKTWPQQSKMIAPQQTSIAAILPEQPPQTCHEKQITTTKKRIPTEPDHRHAVGGAATRSFPGAHPRPLTPARSPWANHYLRSGWNGGSMSTHRPWPRPSSIIGKASPESRSTSAFAFASASASASASESPAMPALPP